MSLFIVMLKIFKIQSLREILIYEQNKRQMFEIIQHLFKIPFPFLIINEQYELSN